MGCSYGELSKHSTNVLNVSKGPSNVVLYESVNEVGSVLIKPSLNVITFGGLLRISTSYPPLIAASPG